MKYKKNNSKTAKRNNMTITDSVTAARNAVIWANINLDIIIRFQKYFEELLASPEKRKEDPDRDHIIVSFRQKTTKDAVFEFFRAYEALRINLFDGLNITNEEKNNANNIKEEIKRLIIDTSSGFSFKEIRHQANTAHMTYLRPEDLLSSKIAIKINDVKLIFDKLSQLSLILQKGGHKHPQIQQREYLINELMKLNK